MMTKQQIHRARRKAGCPPLVPIAWTPEMDGALRELRSRGIGFDRCGLVIGVASTTVAKRVAALALPKVAPATRGTAL